MRKSLAERLGWGALWLAGSLVLLCAVILVIVVLRRSGLQDAANVAQLVSIPLAVLPLLVSLGIWLLRRIRPVNAPRPTAEPSGESTVEMRIVPAPTNAPAVLRRFGTGKAVRPLALGVRPAIPLAVEKSGLDEELPSFVQRSAQVSLTRVLRRARAHGGLCVLVGDSAVGKTRLLYECVRAELSDFAVVVPDQGDGSVVDRLAEQADSLPPLAIWLDELHRFLDGPFRLDGDTPVGLTTIRRLLAAPTRS